ncbi:MAG: acyl-CoA dehydrogenase family protein [Bacteroidetes bacterium]|nr:acyl-CoA dehydrogenase family protein [Bacteroidota bacterium]
MDTVTKATLKGGEFLIKPSTPENTFIPEHLNEEHRMMWEMANDFLDKEVTPVLDRIDAMEEGLMESLVDKAGELGLLGVSVPEAYGGLGKDFITGMLMTEALGAGHSFSVAMAAHTGIGTLPILYFGNETQKQQYLPKLATGEWKASYCLTEPGSGSDALAAKTKAEISKDGKSYILNGQKMWITNAGFADLFIVFAQLHSEKFPAEKPGFTGFIVERETPGLSLGNEEHKMGIKGSSTRQVFFQDCIIPKENLLGEEGKGHLIAFNILNIGRAKLAAAALGASKKVCTKSIDYALTREQFKMPIAKFGAIRYKLAEQAMRIFACESALFRISYLIEQKQLDLQQAGKDYATSLLGAAEEYAVECAMLKVYGSEVLDYVVDEGVQIYGGYGFSADYPMDRAYRDSRINRIFEGTNEINRLLTVDMLLKRAMKGELDLMTPATNVQKELMEIPDFGSNGDDIPFASEYKTIEQLKKCVLMVAGSAVQKYMMKLATEQEILMNIADMAMYVFVAESILLRVHKLSMEGKATALHSQLLQLYIYDSAEKINSAGKNAIVSMSDGDQMQLLLLGLKRFTKANPINTRDARRAIAKALTEAGEYCF